MLTIAIVGLPNAGKSTLFNRLTLPKMAIVDSNPGVTRDRKEAEARLSDLVFKLIDTGGFEQKTNFSELIWEQIKLAIAEADIILFLVDARVSDGAEVKKLAKWLCQYAVSPILLVANKCESDKKCNDLSYLDHFNFFGPAYISAEHNLGMIDLYDHLSEIIKSKNLTFVDTQPSKHNETLKIAIVGRPNVGKSTLINTLLNENRVIVSPEAGTTRDAINIPYQYNNNNILLIDTAGMRKRTNVVDNLEIASVKDSILAIKRSNVAVLVIDYTQGIEHQDLSIAEIAISENKALIFVLNKCDLIEQKKRKDIMQSLRTWQINKCNYNSPIIEISALKGINYLQVIEKSLELNLLLRKRFSTASLNKWLLYAVDHHRPALYKGKKITLKYITQINILPPTFIIMVNIIAGINADYQRYLINSFRQYFNVSGVPIKLVFKKSNNPYVKNS